MDESGTFGDRFAAVLRVALPIYLLALAALALVIAFALMWPGLSPQTRGLIAGGGTIVIGASMGAAIAVRSRRIGHP